MTGKLYILVVVPVIFTLVENFSMAGLLQRKKAQPALVSAVAQPIPAAAARVVNG